VGVGVLALRRGIEPVPVLHGGGQEREVRSGTLDVAAVAGLAVAARKAVAERAERTTRIAALRDELERRIIEVVPDVRVNGGRPQSRLPGHLHLSFPGCEGDLLLMLLDAEGVECSTGSACSAGVPAASHVLLAMGRTEEVARSSLRMTLGHTTTRADVERAGAAIGPAVERARAAGLLAGLGSEVSS
jgi:cysteine desulfurase